MLLVKAEQFMAICLLLGLLIVCRRAGVAASAIATTQNDAMHSVFACTSIAHTGHVKLCYYDSASFLISGDGHFQVDDIDPFICTNVVYASVGVDFRQMLVHRRQYQDMRYGDYSGLMRLKRKNQHLKVMFSLKIGQPQLSYALARPGRYHRLVNNTFEFIKKYQLDGVDIAVNPAQPTEKWLLDAFIQYLREKLGRKRVITLTVPSDWSVIEMGYDFPKLNRYVDFYNFFAFNMNNEHAMNETTLRMPLRDTRPDDEEPMANVLEYINYLFDRGAQSTKILLGVALHAQTYILNNTLNTGLHAAIVGPGPGGLMTNKNGSLSYAEVCLTLSEGDWTVLYNAEMAAVYAYRGDQWMTYETPRTMKGKHKFVKEMQLGGLMVWSIDADDNDMNFVCGPNRNMLMEVLWLDDLKVLDV